MENVHLIIYSIATEYEGEVACYNLPFCALNNSRAKQMVFASVKDVIGKENFDKFSLYQVGYFYPDDRCLPIESYDPCFVCTVNDVIAELEKESKHE